MKKKIIINRTNNVYIVYYYYIIHTFKRYISLRTNKFNERKYYNDNDTQFTRKYGRPAHYKQTGGHIISYLYSCIVKIKNSLQTVK